MLCSKKAVTGLALQTHQSPDRSRIFSIFITTFNLSQQIVDRTQIFLLLWIVSTVTALMQIFNHWFSYSAKSPVLHYLQSRVKSQRSNCSESFSGMSYKETVIQLFQWDLQNIIISFHFGNGGPSYISHRLVLVISGSKCGGEDLHLF